MEKGIQGNINLRRNGEEEEAVDLSGKVHLLPCCIKFNGPCDVSNYFKPKPTGMESEGLKTQEAYFRGRKLQGACVSIPDGYSGFVLGKKSLDKRNASHRSDGNSNCWEINAKYKSITYWNHDSVPSQDDALLRSFHWLSVAKTMHEPVTAEDLVSASAALEKLN
ncbi:uncharacterized protein LOC126789064 [Argentina anserina]|uniref:uncharacterized protein LOC126789064 n=1 Tax=Argentina anserina TaxID=57926 RepID=UPI0021762473|nr:uncharacterized protein LOC126789064 [Potentilla anserina]